MRWIEKWQAMVVRHVVYADHLGLMEQAERRIQNWSTVDATIGEVVSIEQLAV